MPAKASLPMNAGAENTITVAISQPGVTVAFAASRFGVDLAEVNAMTAQNAEILVPKYVANLSLSENYNLLTQSKKALVAQDMASLIAGGKQFATVDEVKSYLADAIAAAYDPSADNYTSFETFTLQNVKTSSIISDAQEENKGFVQLYVPEGTDVTNLTPVFTTTGQASVSPSGAQNFSGPVTYLVDNGEAVKQYTVTVTAAQDAQAVTNVLVWEDFESYGVGAKPNGRHCPVQAPMRADATPLAATTPPKTM